MISAALCVVHLLKIAFQIILSQLYGERKLLTQTSFVERLLT